MIRSALCSLFFTGLCLALPALGFSDNTDDILPLATSPALDLTALTVTFGLDSIELKLTFNPTTNTSIDVDSLGGFVDFDVDLDENTGRSAHIGDFGYVPNPPMGADFYVAIYPNSGIAELFYFNEEGESIVRHYPTTINQTTMSVLIPRCALGPSDGLCMGARFKMAAILGNGDGPTDRAPDDEFPFIGVPIPGDFDEDGDVDGDDVVQFKACATRANVPYQAGTYPPSCTLVPNGQGIIPADLDGDHDVDQDDFGVLQRNLSAAF